MQVLGIVGPADEAATLAERVSDALAARGRVAVVAANEGTADEDHKEAKASLARLEGLGSVTLLPGHRNPWRGEIDPALALARQRRYSLAPLLN